MIQAPSPNIELKVSDSLFSHLTTYETLMPHQKNFSEGKIGFKQFEEISSVLKLLAFKIRFMTWNMLFNLNDERLLPCNRWPERLPRIVKLISLIDPDIIGAQELYGAQKAQLAESLKSIYSVYGPPGPGKTKEFKEHNPIIYKRDRFTVKHKMLREMRFDVKNGKKSGFDDKAITVMVLFDQVSKKDLAVLNTHLSFDSPDAREIQVSLLLNLADQYRPTYPVIILGDFNFFPLRTDMSSIKPLPSHDGDYLTQLFLKRSFRRAVLWSVAGHAGPNSTFTNNPPRAEPFEGTGTPGVELDEFFISEKVTVVFHLVEPAKINGHYPSDHTPKIMDVLITS